VKAFATDKFGFPLRDARVTGGLHSPVSGGGLIGRTRHFRGGLDRAGGSTGLEDRAFASTKRAAGMAGRWHSNSALRQAPLCGGLASAHHEAAPWAHDFDCDDRRYQMCRAAGGIDRRGDAGSAFARWKPARTCCRSRGSAGHRGRLRSIRPLRTRRPRLMGPAVHIGNKPAHGLVLVQISLLWWAIS